MPKGERAQNGEGAKCNGIQASCDDQSAKCDGIQTVCGGHKCNDGCNGQKIQKSTGMRQCSLPLIERWWTHSSRSRACMSLVPPAGGSMQLLPAAFERPPLVSLMAVRSSGHSAKV